MSYSQNAIVRYTEILERNITAIFVRDVAILGLLIPEKAQFRKFERFLRRARLFWCKIKAASD
jgi:hypothetical protein